MKPKASFHEILLFPGTGHCRRSFCRRDTYNNNTNKLSAIEELERACWDGMIYEIFPDILVGFANKCESFIWQTMTGKNFLSISIGAVPPAINNETTIDPYLYMIIAHEN